MFELGLLAHVLTIGSFGLKESRLQSAAMSSPYIPSRCSHMTAVLSSSRVIVHPLDVGGPTCG
jgi:hypothetical protein